MAELHIVGKDGTPRGRHLFAAFEDEAAARRAEQQLAAEGVEFIHLHGAVDADGLKHCTAHSPLWKLERFLKNIGGESHEAQRYAKHLEKGQVVVALPVHDRASAVEITYKLLQNGAYDVTYYAGWTIEHTSWEADSQRGLPTFTTSNTEVFAKPHPSLVDKMRSIVAAIHGHWYENGRWSWYENGRLWRYEDGRFWCEDDPAAVRSPVGSSQG
jgi:hypothetical protein